MPQGQGWISIHRNGSWISVEYGVKSITTVMPMFVLRVSAIMSAWVVYLIGASM